MTPERQQELRARSKFLLSEEAGIGSLKPTHGNLRDARDILSLLDALAARDAEWKGLHGALVDAGDVTCDEAGLRELVRQREALRAEVARLTRRTEELERVLRDCEPWAHAITGAEPHRITKAPAASTDEHAINCPGCSAREVLK